MSFDVVCSFETFYSRIKKLAEEPRKFGGKVDTGSPALSVDYDSLPSNVEAEIFSGERASTLGEGNAEKVRTDKI